MSLVLDASLTLAWCFRDETTPYTNDVLRYVEEHGAVVPELWVYEVANGLASGLRRQPPRVSEDDIQQFIQALAALPIDVHPTDREVALRNIRRLATTHSISSYDAAYLSLAIELSLPLGTLDGSGRRAGLKQAAEAAGVALFKVPR